jgi:hypothetical protein
MRKYLKSFESLKTEYSGLYVTPIELDKTYNRFLDLYSIEIKRAMKDLCIMINSKYGDSLAVKMRRNIQPGLILKPNSANIQHICKDIYDFFNEREIDVRVVYGYGGVDEISNDIHRCYGDLLVKIGHTTDELKKKKGIFKA